MRHGTPGSLRVDPTATVTWTVPRRAVEKGESPARSLPPGEAIKITGQTSRPTLTLFADPATYLLIQLDIGPLRISFQWLPATPVRALATVHRRALRSSRESEA